MTDNKFLQTVIENINNIGFKDVDCQATDNGTVIVHFNEKLKNGLNSYEEIDINFDNQKFSDIVFGNQYTDDTYAQLNPYQVVELQSILNLLRKYR